MSNYPAKLYRYRPLTDDLIDRELESLRESYLYAPSFSKMNDPMEAFYEIGGKSDNFLAALLIETPRGLTDLYKMLKDTIDKFALLSFSRTHEDLPMWAYYASNFAGMCLEFETAELDIGDLRGEELFEVKYVLKPPPALTVSLMPGDRLKQAMMACVTCKRQEWAHENEWRFVTGSEGKKHFVDDALKRVFLGPRVSNQHAERICDVLKRRPVDVLQAEIKGFALEFRLKQKATPLAACERVGAGLFKIEEIAYQENELRQFLKVPYDRLLEECQKIASRPNLELFDGIGISSKENDALYCLPRYKLRNGRDSWHRYHFDRNMQPKAISG